MRRTTPAPCEKILISGASGYGKSTLAKAMVKAKKRVVIFDPMDEYHLLRDVSRVTSLTALKAHIVRGGGKQFKVAYHPSGMGDHRLPQALNHLCDMLMQGQRPYKEGHSTLQMALFVEEASIAAPNHQLGRGGDAFSYVSRIGRHYGIEVIAVTQRYKEVLKTFRGNCPTQIYFRLTEPDDVKEVEKLPGMGPYKGKIGSLGMHHYIRLDGGQASAGKNKL